MKLASLKSGNRDGTLLLVNRSLTHCIAVPDIAATLQAALDDWDALAPLLAKRYQELCQGLLPDAQPFIAQDCHAPLPRAYQWADGSAYVNHVELTRRAYGVPMPATFWSEPLIYQGGSDSLCGPYDPIDALSEDWGIDMEGEIAVITGDVRMGASTDDAAASIRLIMLANDVSLRHLILEETGKGFGFYQSKPATSFSPVAVTPDELDTRWVDGRLHGALQVHLNGQLFGHPDAGQDMVFSFPQLIAHAARTRELSAGSIIGSGTVSNKQDGLHGSSISNGGVGYACLAELRMYETITGGSAQTDYLQFGDSVRIEMLDEHGQSIFGAIQQTVRDYLR